MKLVGELKNKVEKAESKDEKKKLIEHAGMLLDDEELDQIAGAGAEGNIQTQMVQLQDYMG